MPKTLYTVKPSGLFYRVLQPLLDFCAGGRHWGFSPAPMSPVFGGSGKYAWFASPLPDPGEPSAWYHRVWSLEGGHSAPGRGRRLPFKRKPAPQAPVAGNAKDVQEAFLYFLSTGVIPESNWTGPSLETALLDKVRKEHQFFGAPPAGSAFCQRLLQLLLANDTALTRLLVQFEEPILEDLFGHTTDFGMVNRWVGWLMEAPGLDRKKLCWQVTLKSLDETGGKVTLASYPAVEKRILHHLLGSLDPGILALWFDHLSAGHKAELLSTLEIDNVGPSTILEILVAVKQRRPHHVAFGRLQAGTEVVIENAGLVLAYPYFPDLFERLDWSDSSGGFRQESMRQRAVLLLQQLVHPGAVCPEDALLLNKTLCGYPTLQTAPRSFDWTEQELAAVEAFYRMILQDFARYGALQHPTPEVLRQNYFRRKGRLTRREHDWLLHVERKPEDGALKGLPWRVHKVRYTWMRRTVYVDWK